MAQIKQLLSTGLFAAIMLCSVAACSNDDNDEIKDTSYTLDDIEWAMLDGDQVKETKMEIPQEVYRNQSDQSMPITVCAVQNFTQTSQFYSDDPELFQLLTQIPSNVYVPSEETSFEGFFHKYGGPEVPLSLEEYTYPPHSYSTHTFEVPSHTITTFNATIIEYKVTATYRAHFTGNNSGKQIEITGKWKGTYYTDYMNRFGSEDIK